MGIRRRSQIAPWGNHFRWSSNYLYIVILLCIANIGVFGSDARISIKSQRYSFSEGNDNRIKINMDGFGSITRPGYPSLPSKIFYIALPPHTKVHSVVVYPQNTEIIPGIYEISAARPLIPSDEDDDCIRSVLSEYRQSKELVWANNQYFPEQAGEYLGIDNFAGSPLVKVQFMPFSYNPATKVLRFVRELMVDISYEKMLTQSNREPRRVSALFWRL